MGSWPDPTPFEAEDGSVSPALDALIRGPGAALAGLLLLAPSEYESGQAARGAAVRLARAWVRTGRRVILADLELAAPALHTWLGVAGDEGLADHFAFGTSVSRLAVPVEDGTWSFVPAGFWAEEPESMLGSAEWPRLLRELSAADATMLAYCPADAPGVAALARVFGAVVVLGSPRELPAVRPFSVLAHLDLGGERTAPSALGPKANWAARESPDEAFERIRLPTDARTREALIADLRHRQRAALMAPPAGVGRASLTGQEVAAPLAVPGGAAAGAGPEAAAGGPAVPDVVQPVLPAAHGAGFPMDTVLVGEPPLLPRVLRAPRRPSRAPLWWALAALVLLLVLVGGWFLLRQRADARRASEDAAETARAQEVPLQWLPQTITTPPPPPAAATDTVLGYAVALQALVRLPSALERLRALRAAMPERRFFIAPLVRSGALYYAVQAGPVSDSVQAEVLLDSLRAEGQLRAGEGTVRNAGYAFLLGEFDSRSAADVRVAALRRLEIPAYILGLAGPPERFRVYAGGYTGAAEAEVMRQILQSVGEPDVLVERVGRR